MPEVINSFQGPHRFLSNFFPSPINWGPGEVVFPTVEHGFVWHKSTNPHFRRMVLAEPKPGKVKRFGRSCVLRDHWDDMKLVIMEDLLVEKFQQHPDLRQKLINTGNAELIEGNHRGDTFWGVCNGVGENHLGELLMKVRSALQ